MISNRKVLDEIRNSWHGVEVLRTKLKGALAGSFVQGGSFAIFMADAAHNVPFLHAYSVLNDVLQQLSKEGHFNSKSIFLGKIIKASEKIPPLQDFSLIKEGADRRNDVAHRGEVLPRAHCWKYIDAIKTELLTWGILKTS
jgi:hypothetical protein